MRVGFYVVRSENLSKTPRGTESDCEEWDSRHVPRGRTRNLPPAHPCAHSYSVLDRAADVDAILELRCSTLRRSGLVLLFGDAPVVCAAATSATVSRHESVSFSSSGLLPIAALPFGRCFFGIDFFASRIRGVTRIGAPRSRSSMLSLEPRRLRMSDANERWIVFVPFVKS